MGQNKCKLIIHKDAQNDLDEIFQYIASILKNPKAAESLIDQIEMEMTQIRQFPYSCPVTDNEMVQDQEVRKLIVKNYLIFYKIIENEIHILRVVYGKMDYNDLL